MVWRAKRKLYGNWMYLKVKKGVQLWSCPVLERD